MATAVLARGKATLENISLFEKAIVGHTVVSRYGAAETCVGGHKSTNVGKEELLLPVSEFSSPQRIYLLHIPHSDF